MMILQILFNCGTLSVCIASSPGFPFEKSKKGEESMGGSLLLT